MAKIIINNEAKINGLTRLVAGDQLLFVEDLIEGQKGFVLETQNIKGDKKFASGVLALQITDDEVRPIIIDYRTLWGVAYSPITVNNVVTRTPQSQYTLSNEILRKGSKAIPTNQPIRITNVFAAEFMKKDKSRTFTWDLLGLELSEEKIKIDDAKITIGKKSFKLSDLRKETEVLLKERNEQQAEYDW